MPRSFRRAPSVAPAATPVAPDTPDTPDAATPDATDIPALLAECQRLADALGALGMAVNLGRSVNLAEMAPAMEARTA